MNLVLRGLKMAFNRTLINEEHLSMGVNSKLNNNQAG